MSWICEVFIEKYIKEEVDDALYDRNKGLLVKLFQDVIDKMPKATEILGVYFWIIWIVDTDNKALLYDIKMKECWSIMIGSWTHDIEACEKLEKVLKDLATTRYFFPMAMNWPLQRCRFRRKTK